MNTQEVADAFVEEHFHPPVNAIGIGKADGEDAIYCYFERKPQKHEGDWPDEYRGLKVVKKVVGKITPA